MLYEIMTIVRARLGDEADRYRMPPPVFAEMGGEFVAYDIEAGTLSARFPVREAYLNPYGAMQGGMVAAAVDNALGPLSMLVAPPNVTRRLEMKYRRPVTPDLEFITVHVELVERRRRRLTFTARVIDPAGNLLASARATHWILDSAEPT